LSKFEIFGILLKSIGVLNILNAR